MKMTSESLDELVFENRNKKYGAYVIRKEYARSLRIGIFATLSFVGALVLCSFGIKSEEVINCNFEVPLVDTGIMIVLPPPPVDHPPVVEKPAGGPKSTTPVLVAANEPVEPLPPAEQLVEGPVSPEPGPGTEPTEPLSGISEGPPAVAPAPTVEVVLAPDEMPDVEGGVMKYLRKHLTYPEIAVQRKTTGTVYVSFVVEKDGSVGNINVLKGIGDGCEEEATRVIKKMKWKPGKNHGIPVRVQFTLPVKFTITE
jgi:protein TonB